MDTYEDIFERTRVPVAADARGVAADAAGVEPPPAGQADTNTNTNFPFDEDSSCRVPRQEQDLWCWAAVTVGIASYHAGSVEWRQCEVVDQAFGRNDCCNNGDSAVCDKPHSLGDALSGTNNLEQRTPAAMGIGAVKDEISRRKPVGARIDWGDDIGHVAAIVGCRHTATDVDLLVSDPWYGDRLTPWEQFATSYQGVGTWSHSYRTKAKG